jgi:flagellar hook-associated protein 2
VGSPITLSGFNSIDFNLILTSIMTQESQPLVALQSRQSALETRLKSLSTLTTRIGALQDAVEDLSSSSDLTSYSATSSDTSAVAVSSGSAAIPGRYEIVVNELARAQVTASASSAPDPDTTVVASGGTITISGVTVNIGGPVTLRQLADAINASAEPPARATVVQTAPGQYKLVLTAKDAGQANAFTITKGLTGGTGVSFTDTDLDGVSGDSAADNAVQALDASVLVNNIPVTSTTNTLESTIPGVTVTLLKKDPASTVVVDVAADPNRLKDKIKTFISAYNDFLKFANDQRAAAGRGEGGSIGRDVVLAQLRNTLRGALTSAFGANGSAGYLSQAGIEFTETGTLKLNEAVFDDAADNGVDLEALFVGTDANPGAFKSVGTMLDSYTQANGLLSGARQQLTSQVTRLTEQIADMQDRLAIRRASLQREFIAADQAMSRLKAQSGSLGAIGSSL